MLFRSVVGVVGDVRHEGLDRDPHPTLYVPHAQSPTGALTFTVRTDGDAAAMLAAVQRQIWTLDRSLPIYGSATMEGLLGASLRARRARQNHPAARSKRRALPALKSAVR